MITEDIDFNALMQPAFEGSVTSYRRELSGLVYGKHDNIAVRELLLLQMRTAHAIRNNGYAKAAFAKYKENMKSLDISWVDKKGKHHQQMQDFWDEFKENPMLDGYGDFNTFQNTHFASIFQAGNSFTRLQIRRRGNKNVIPLKLEMIQPEFHDIMFKGINNIEDIRNGIKFVDSKPETYYFQRARIDSSYEVGNIASTRIEIPANEIIHSFYRDYPNQWIGIPLLSSILIPLYELDDLADATTNKQKVAQAISWIVENTNPMNMTPIGAPGVKKDREGNDKVVFNATGGNVQYLNKGEKLTSIQSSDIGNNLLPFMKSELQRIASAVGIPYYQLTGDYSGIDFSTLRGIAIELRTRIEYTHHFFTIPTLLKPLAYKFKDLASLKSSKVNNAKPSFQLPRWYGVDELKDAQADILEVQNGMSTLKSKLDERHLTFEDIAADRERIKELGLDVLLMENPQKMAQANNNEANNNSTGNA